MAACDHCYRRKVACNAKDRSTCSRCQKKDLECSFKKADEVLRKRHSKQPRSAKGTALQRRVRPRPLPGDHLGTTVHSCPTQDDAATIDGSSGRAPTVSYHSPRAVSDPSTERVHAQGIPLDDGNHVADEAARAAAEAEEPAKTVLAEFCEEKNINRPYPWPQNARLAYVGTTVSNLAHLVRMQTRQPECLHYMYPSIRPGLPRLPDHHSGLGRTFDTSGHRFIARDSVKPPAAFDAGHLPDQETCERLVDAYFSRVNAGFPVVDELMFRSKLRQYFEDGSEGQNVGKLPLLLLQCVLLAGVRVCDHPSIVQSGAALGAALFRRAKTLFDLRYEIDRLHLVQAALLFVMHADGADDVSANAYYWSGTAARIAMGLGYHRSTRLSTLSAFDKREYRRLWWIIVQIEVLVCLTYGRPLTIDMDESDVECPTENCVTQEDEMGDGVCRQMTPIRTSFYIYNTTLCLIIIRILKLHSPGSIARLGGPESTDMQAAKADLNTQLGSWFMRLPPDLGSPRREPHNFWIAQLHVHYYTALLSLNRKLPLSDHYGSPGLPFPSHGIDADPVVCSGAASNITALFEGIIAAGTLSQCSFTAMTAILAVVIQISGEVRRADCIHSSTAVVALDALSRFEALFHILEALGAYDPYAEGILRLCKGTSAKFSFRIATQFPDDVQDPNMRQNTGIDHPDVDLGGLDLFMTAATDHPDVNWSDIFRADLDGQMPMHPGYVCQPNGVYQM